MSACVGSLRKKLKGLLEQIDVREEHFKKQLKAKELEHKLEEAKHAQTSSRLEQAQQEVRRAPARGTRHALTPRGPPLQTQATRKEAEAARASEATTREKLDAYVEKFESFQGTLSKSNETFKLYQSELKKVWAERGLPARPSRSAFPLGLPGRAGLTGGRVARR